MKKSSFPPLLNASLDMLNVARIAAGEYQSHIPGFYNTTAFYHSFKQQGGGGG